MSILECGNWELNDNFPISHSPIPKFPHSLPASPITPLPAYYSSLPRPSGRGSKDFKIIVWGFSPRWFESGTNNPGQSPGKIIVAHYPRPEGRGKKEEISSGVVLTLPDQRLIARINTYFALLRKEGSPQISLTISAAAANFLLPVLAANRIYGSKDLSSQHARLFEGIE